MHTASSIFTNDFFPIIFSYASILEMRETKNKLPPHTSRHSTVRQETHLFSKFLDTIRESLNSNETSQNVTLFTTIISLVHNRLKCSQNRFHLNIKKKVLTTNLRR